MKIKAFHIPILSTKFHRPPVPEGIVRRRELEQRLEKSHHKPLILVSAPAGYGKSTLVAGWLEQSKKPSAWLSLGETDNNLHQFASYFTAAIDRIFPGAVKETINLLNASSLPPTSVLTVTLINELERMNKNGVVVLDDIHCIRETEVYRFIKLLLQYPSSSLQLVMIGRCDPILPIAAMRAKGLLTEVRMLDLRFSEKESIQYLQCAMAHPVEESMAVAIAEKSEGWVTGLRLSAFVMRRQDYFGRDLLELKGNIVYVMDYLIAEVLNHQSRAIRHFLLITAILDRFTPALCDALMEEGSEQGQSQMDGVQFISKLQHENLFLIALDNEGRWFRYHHLFQGFLRGQLNQILPPEEIKTLHLRACHWFEVEGFIEEAIQQALKAGDVIRAARIVERKRHAALDADHWYLLLQWLDKLPHEMKESRLELLLSKAWILLLSARLGELPSIIERIQSFADEGALQPVVLSEITFFQALICYLQGDGKHSAALFNHAAQLIPENDFRFLQSETDYFTCVALHMDGQKKKAVQKLFAGIQSSDPADGMTLSRLTFGLCFIHMLDSEYLRAFQAGMRLKEVGCSNRLALAGSWGRYTQGNASFQMFDLKNAQHYFHSFVENRYVTNPRAAVDGMAGLALTYELMKKPDESDEIIRLAETYALWAKDYVYVEIVRSCRARLDLLRGDIDSAFTWQQSLIEMPGTQLMLFFLEIPAITECRVLISMGSESSLKDAVGKLNTLFQTASAYHNTCQVIEIMILQARARHRQGRFKDALEVLERAAALAKPGRFIRPFIEAGRSMIELLKHLTEKNVADSFIKKLLNAFPNHTETAPTEAPLSLSPNHQTAQPLLEPLTHRELDVLGLLAKRFRNKEIGERLFISHETVRTHLVNIYQKFSVKNRRDAVTQAMALGILKN